MGDALEMRMVATFARRKAMFGSPQGDGFTQRAEPPKMEGCTNPDKERTR
jgi:hypothetical protein